MEWLDFGHMGWYWVWIFLSTRVDIGFGTFVPRGWILGLDLFGHVGGYWVWIFSQEWLDFNHECGLGLDFWPIGSILGLDFLPRGWIRFVFTWGGLVLGFWLCGWQRFLLVYLTTWLDCVLILPTLGWTFFSFFLSGWILGLYIEPYAPPCGL